MDGEKVEKRNGFVWFIGGFFRIFAKLKNDSPTFNPT